MKTLLTKLFAGYYSLTNIMKTINLFPALLTFLFFFIPAIIFAQVIETDPEISAPIDGGLSILIAAGVGYGVKKALQNKKRQENNL